MSGLVAIGHGIYLLATEDFRWSKKVKAYLLALLAGWLTFLPWLSVFLIDKPHKKVGLSFFPEGLLSSVKHWVGILSRIFFDFNVTTAASPQFLIPLKILGLLLLLLTGYSIYFLYRHAAQRVWLFILVLILVIPVALIPKGSLSATIPPRYLLPSYLGIQISVSYLITIQITSSSANLKKQKLWQIVAIALVLLGIASCGMNSSAKTWWNKQSSFCYFQAARVINQAYNPLAIGEANGRRVDSALGNIVSLSYLLDPKVKLLLVVEPNVPQIPDGFSDVFLVTPSQGLRYKIERTSPWQLEPVIKYNKPIRGSTICLWKLIPKVSLPPTQLRQLSLQSPTKFNVKLM
ncbi:MAG TPA: hypothetical protein DDZ80_05665 [Cyanobacteria bacterium UBA8803]|nr:hypothetical protein [Cyanobacteria bacterium UBA9273]HBL58024.1 hypothetical protein [Cyanobacteria bacterium UBA8803]